MKKVIITGAAGFLGLNLLTALNTNKNNVVAIDKNNHNLLLATKINSKIRVLCADLSVYDKKWEKSFKSADCVIQLQAQLASPKEEDYIKNNVISTKNVISACKKYKVNNLVYISTTAVASVKDNIYNHTKKIGEELVKKSGIPYTILRPSWMYGCFDIKHFGFFIRIMSRSFIFPVPGNGKYLRQPLYVDDIINIIVKLVTEKPKNKTLIIVGKEKIYFVDLLKMIAKELNKSFLFIKIPIPIFILLLKLFSLLTNKKPFEITQMKSLMAGDIFPFTNWDKKFKVNCTAFKNGIRNMLHSEYYKYGALMKE